MFYMFNRVLLLSEGYPVYYGNAKDSMDYFSSLHFTPEIAMNPAEFLLNLATGQINDITVPDDLRSIQDTPEYEKVVLKVSTRFLLCHNFKIHGCVTSLNILSVVY